MTDPKPRPTASSTRSVPVAWSRCSATGTAAEPAVVGDAVLADLKDHRRGRGLGARDDRLGVLDADDVERADAAARRRGRAYDLRHPRRRHQPASPRTTVTPASAVA